MLKLLLKPVSFFDSLKERRPRMLIPFLLIFFTGIIEGFTFLLAIEDMTITEVFNSQGLDILLKSVLIADIVFFMIISLQIILFPFIIRKLGGTGGSRRHSIYIIGVSTFPILIQSIIHFVFPQLIWWNNFSHLSVLYYLSYSIFNLLNIWSVAILVIGFARVYKVSYKIASILYLQFLLKLIPLAVISIILN